MMKRSIYLQLVRMLIGIVFISNLLVFFTFVLTTERHMLAEMDAAMSELTTHLKHLYDLEILEADRIPPLLRTGYFRADIYENSEQLHGEALVRKFFREEDLAQLESVDEIRSRAYGHKGRDFRLPSAIVHLRRGQESQFLFIYPDLSKLMFNFRSIIARVNVTSLLVGSIMILLAAKYIVRPIKELSEATRQISKGNFDVTVKEERRDEIGQLIDGFNSMANELKSIEILRGDFVSAISHEFKTPLTSIRGYARLLAETNDDVQRKEYASIISEETERLSRLASSILLISRLENDSSELDKHTFRLDEQLRKVLLLLERDWGDKQVELDVDLTAIEYLGNEQLLFQVWLNILDNAIKFSRPGGKLLVHLGRDGDNIVCSIQDSGMGIPQEQQRRVFEKFYKGDRSRGTAGSGLGLSIAKRIVEMHNGQITLTSTLGVGTTVTVTLQRDTDTTGHA